MKLIPVLDLRGGLVVHAHRGNRSAYRPVETYLCRGSRPL
ncbi:MAG: nickel transporter, partial [Dehalococcoidia bacterium]|nr:nickel transporter [Dehalococcoidia bacterium]